MFRQCLLILFTLLLSACSSKGVMMPLPAKEPKATYLQHVHPQVVLVLGMGSARGFAHAGVIKALEKNHIPIDMIVGTSAGSIVGALYADHPSATALERLVLATPRDQVISFSFANILYGPVSGEVLQQYLTANLKSKTFDQLPIPFIAVAANLKTGAKHAFASGPIAPAVNASSAAPPFFPPVELYGETYIDGGTVDPVAVDVARRFHPKIIIAVNLDPNQPSYAPYMSPEVFLRGVWIMMSQLSALSAQGADIIIRPELEDNGMFNGEERERTIASGYDATTKLIPAIKKLMAKHRIPLR